MSGVMLGLSYPPFHTLVLPFVALVPLVVVLVRCPNDRAAFEGGAVFSVVHFGVVCYWVPLALADITVLAWPLFVAGLGLFSLVGGAAAVLLHRHVGAKNAPAWLVVPVVWTGFEWSLAHLPGSLAYPWLGLGTTLTGFPVLVGFAEFVGARGVTFWLALVNGAVASAVLGRTPRGGVRRTALGAVVVAPALLGWWSTVNLEPDVSVPVAVIRTDVDQVARRGPGAENELLASAERAAEGIEQGSVALVVLPEGAVPSSVDAGASAGALARIQAVSVAVGAPVLFGASMSGLSASNGAHLMEPRGLTGFHYEKQRLVPFVEGSLFDRPAAPTAELESLVALVGGVRFGVLICYESAFPEVARGARQAGADVLVNITNDAWSGGGQRRTTAYWQHPSHLVMRAIETRAGVVRAANGGLALFVDPSGRVHDVRAEGEGHVVATVTSVSAPTLFERTGDVVGGASGAAFWLLLLLALGGRIGPFRP